MNTHPIILDGSKFNWHTAVNRRTGRSVSDGLGFTGDHPGFPTGGRPPAHVAVRSHRTGAVVVFNFVELAEEDGEQTLNYEGTLPDGSYCALALAAG